MIFTQVTIALSFAWSTPATAAAEAVRRFAWSTPATAAAEAVRRLPATVYAMPKLPTDLDILDAIYRLYYDTFVDYSEEKPT